jgi:hypothetical protein
MPASLSTSAKAGRDDDKDREDREHGAPRGAQAEGRILQDLPGLMSGRAEFPHARSSPVLLVLRLRLRSGSPQPEIFDEVLIRGYGLCYV